MSNDSLNLILIPFGSLLFFALVDVPDPACMGPGRNHERRLAVYTVSLVSDLCSLPATSFALRS